MNVFRRDKALDDVAHHALYLAQNNPDAAQRFIVAFAEATERLAQMPYLGAACYVENPLLFGLRRWPIKGFEKHIIFYLVIEDALDIVRVLHSAQDIATALEVEP